MSAVRPNLVSVLPARRGDLGAIMDLERSGFGAGERWSERSWLGELLGVGRTVLIARAHVPVGVIALQTVGEVGDLHRLVVAPGWRRRGVGSALVETGLQTVRHHGARSVLLEVEFGNDAAIALYQRLGFEQLAARDDYYGPGRRALILKLYDLPGWETP